MYIAFSVQISQIAGAPQVFDMPAAQILRQEFAEFLTAKTDVLVTIPDTMPHLTVRNIRSIVKALVDGGYGSLVKNQLHILNKKSAEKKAMQGDLSEYDMLFTTDTPEGLVKSCETLRLNIIDKHVQNGVMIYNPHSVTIYPDVAIGGNATIHQNNYLAGNTHIGSGCLLMPGNSITDSVIGSGSTLKSSTIEQARVGKNCSIGPNAYIRPGSSIGNDCRIGDFVEIKNAEIGDGTKVSHLTYVGDATLGKSVNLGCGVVFVNYNGKSKSRSFVGDGSFVGCNCNIISPVQIGRDCYVAAGTTVTENLNDGDFCIGRSRQVVKSGKAAKYLKK